MMIKSRSCVRSVLVSLVIGFVLAANAALSPTMKIIAPLAGSNLDWGQLHATTVQLNWSWPNGATSAELVIVANGRENAVFSRTFPDTAVRSCSWDMGVPVEDTVYDVTLTFNNDVVQKAQLYANLGSFGGVELKGWNDAGEAKVTKGCVLPYRAAWAEGLAGAATLSIDAEQIALDNSDGYSYLRFSQPGVRQAELDFETEPSSPAFSAYLKVVCNGFVVLFF